MNLNALIVDDEELGRERIRMLLEAFPNIAICGECADGLQAVDKIEELNPDLVFLDIQMPNLDGFGVISELQASDIPCPIVIFVTAYNEHAVKAFEVNAIDYVLKPVQADRLEMAIQRAEAQLTKKQPDIWQSKISELLQATRPERFLQTIEIRSQGRTDYVSVANITWLKADRNYMEVYTRQQTHIARVTLSELERQLDPNSFQRVSRSAMVNLRCVSTIQTSNQRGHDIVLTDGTIVPLKRPLEELQHRLKYRS